MDKEELRKLVVLPESDMLEFKTHLPNPNLIARLISAFANSKGGKLIVGVREGGEVVGIGEPARAQRALKQATDKISPSIDIQTEVVDLDGKAILVTTIPKGQFPPYLAEGEAFQRKGDRIVRSSVYAPDVSESAYQAVISGSGAVAQGRGGVSAGEGGIAVGGDVGEVIVGRTAYFDIIPYETAFERVVGSTTFVLRQLELSYRQTREQSQGWFRFSLIAACVGFVLVGTGVIAVIFGQTTAGVITAISSVVPDVAAALFFVQSRAANGRVDTIQANLTEARDIQTAVEIVNTINDPKARDDLKAEIVRKALRLEQGASDSRPTTA